MKYYYHKWGIMKWELRQTHMWNIYLILWAQVTTFYFQFGSQRSTNFVYKYGYMLKYYYHKCGIMKWELRQAHVWNIY